MRHQLVVSTDEVVVDHPPENKSPLRSLSSGTACRQPVESFQRLCDCQIEFEE
jgi:hypothetical protein